MGDVLRDLDKLEGKIKRYLEKIDKLEEAKKE